MDGDNCGRIGSFLLPLYGYEDINIGMKVLITGGNGRLGKLLKEKFIESSYFVDTPTRLQVDWASAVQSNAAIQGGRYSLIVGCAAYTDVAKAQIERAKCHADTYATALNTAKAAKVHGVPFVYISTDYVIPILRGEGGGFYAHSKYRAEQAVMREGGRIVRVAFTTEDQASKWSFVNTYSKSNRWWVNEAVPPLVEAILDQSLPQIHEIGPDIPVTPFDLLKKRFPDHPALQNKVDTPEQMKALVGYSAPKDSTFFSYRNGKENLRWSSLT
jgi:hypothetical protein